MCLPGLFLPLSFNSLETIQPITIFYIYKWFEIGRNDRFFFTKERMRWGEELRRAQPHKKSGEKERWKMMIPQALRHPEAPVWPPMVKCDRPSFEGFF